MRVFSFWGFIGKGECSIILLHLRGGFKKEAG
jgi:hypothetical protein